MKTIVEIFFVTRVPEGFHWMRREIDISQDRQDPDKIVTDYLYYFFADSKVITQKDRYILHSTSWRYVEPQSLLLTYIVYADTLSFAHLEPGLLSKNEINMAHSTNPKVPRPVARILPEQVLSHGIRHLAYLIVNDNKNVYRSVISKDTQQYFELLHLSLAGCVS
jgi:hypothetical protein